MDSRGVVSSLIARLNARLSDHRSFNSSSPMGPRGCMRAFPPRCQVRIPLLVQQALAHPRLMNDAAYRAVFSAACFEPGPWIKLDGYARELLRIWSSPIALSWIGVLRVLLIRWCKAKLSCFSSNLPAAVHNS